MSMTYLVLLIFGLDWVSKACIGSGDSLAHMLSNLSNFKEFYSKTEPIFWSWAWFLKNTRTCRDFSILSHFKENLIAKHRLPIRILKLSMIFWKHTYLLWFLFFFVNASTSPEFKPIRILTRIKKYTVLVYMSVFYFLCTEIGTFWPNRDPPKLKPNFWKLFEHHISFQSQLCTCSPHFFLRLHLLTTFLIKVALAHHISFYGCTCSPHFFLRLHLLTTFLFTSRFRVQGLKHDIGRKFQLLYTCRCKK